MQHGDVGKNIASALACTFEVWHCKSLTDLIDEMGPWNHELGKQRFLVTIGTVFATVKKCPAVTWVDQIDPKLDSVLVPGKMSWARATLSIWKCKIRIKKTGGSCVDTELIAWGLDAHVWTLLWIGEVALKKGMPILKKAGFESIEDLSMTAVAFSSKAYQDLPPHLRLSTTSNGKERV